MALIEETIDMLTTATHLLTLELAARSTSAEG